MALPASLSLVIPVLNEEDVIAQTLGIYNSQLEKMFQSYEIIVVDSGSTDKTRIILGDLAKTMLHLKVIDQSVNRGIADAILCGFQECKYEWALFNSADRPFDLKDMQKIASMFDSADVLVARRVDNHVHPFLRRLSSRLNVFLLRTIFKIPLDDFQFVVLLRKKLVKNMKLVSNGSLGQAEILIRLYKGGYRVVQFPAVFHERTAGSSKFNNPIRHIQHFVDMIRLRVKINF